MTESSLLISSVCQISFLLLLRLFLRERSRVQISRPAPPRYLVYVILEIADVVDSEGEDMDSWFQKARDFAQEAAKKSQELAKEAAKLSQEIAAETAKKSKEIAVEATKKADQIKIEATKRADQFKSFAGEISPSIASVAPSVVPKKSDPLTAAEDLEKYGVTEELREFVKGLTLNTFQDFPVDNSALDENQVPKASPSSNIRQDLTEWQEKHAVLVLSTVKEISHFRYVLCPRHMKESQFWKIYFILVKSHVAPYEMRALQQLKSSSAEHERNIRLQDNLGITTSEVEMAATSGSTKKIATSSVDQDLDAYLMGDLSSNDEVPDEGDDGFDDDFDKLVNSTALDSEDEGETTNDESKVINKTSTKLLTTSDGSSDGELVEMPMEH